MDFVQNFDLDFPDLKNMMNIPEFDNIAFEVMLNNNSGSSMINCSIIIER
jgi:hypothetical protein